MGGIWFWSVMGLGIAIAQIIDRTSAERAAMPDEVTAGAGAASA